MTNHRANSLLHAIAMAASKDASERYRGEFLIHTYTPTADWLKEKLSDIRAEGRFGDIRERSSDLLQTTAEGFALLLAITIKQVADGPEGSDRVAEKLADHIKVFMLKELKTMHEPSSSDPSRTV